MQNLKILSAFVCALLFCSIPLTAQFDFRKGYIVTTKGDTVSGFVKDQTFDKLSKQVVFKTDRKSETDAYLPAELKAYGFEDGDVFESYEIEYTSASRRGKTKDVRIVRFLSKLLDGKISIYELSEKEGPLFIKKENGSLQLLCVREVLVEEVYDENGAPKSTQPGKKYKDANGNRLIERDGQYYLLKNEYLEILKSEMADCDKMIFKDKMPLKKSLILKLVMQYNKHCSPADYQRLLDNQSARPIGRFTLYSNTPLPYLKEYGGLGGGLMMEVGNNRFSATLLFEYAVGDKNAADYNYKMFTASLRANYRITENKKLTPYVFTGASTSFADLKDDLEIDGLNDRSYLNIEAGFGLDLMLGDRFFAKGEIAYPHFPNVRIGLGMLIK